MCTLEESRSGYSRIKFHTDELDALQFPYLSMKVRNLVTRILDGTSLTLPHIDFNRVYISDLAMILATFEQKTTFEFIKDALHTMILEEASYTEGMASLRDRRKWRQSIERCRRWTLLRTASIPDVDDPITGAAAVRTVLYLPSMEALLD
jgi:hypothetical protein